MFDPFKPRRASAGADAVLAALLLATLGPPPSKEATAAYNKANPFCEDPTCAACNLRRVLAGDEPLTAKPKVDAASDKDQHAELSITALSDTSRSMVGLSDIEPEDAQNLKAPAAALITRLEKLRDAHPVGSQRYAAAELAIDKAIAASRAAIRALSD